MLRSSLSSLAQTLALLFAFTPLSVFAQDTRGAMSYVAGPLNGAIGGAEIGGIVAFVFATGIPVISVIAVLLIVRAGLILAASQREEEFTKTRATVVSCVVAIIIGNTALVIGRILYASFNQNIVASPEVSAATTTSEVRGLIEFLEVPLAAAAVLILIVVGIRTVLSYGSATTQNLRQAVIAICSAMILLSVKFAITRDVVITHRPDNVIDTIITVINIILGFMALLAVAVIVYGGFKMIINFSGADDQFKQGRDLVVRVGIGLIIIVMSLGIVNFILSFQG